MIIMCTTAVAKNTKAQNFEFLQNKLAPDEMLYSICTAVIATIAAYFAYIHSKTHMLQSSIYALIAVIFVIRNYSTVYGEQRRARQCREALELFVQGRTPIDRDYSSAIMVVFTNIVVVAVTYVCCTLDDAYKYLAF
jgi:hypothetical protein